MDIQHQILEKMKAYDTIMLFRHSRVDGDCVGATKGMKALIQASFPDKKVLIVDDEHSDYLAFLGEDDAPVADDVYAQSLCGLCWMFPSPAAFPTRSTRCARSL